MISSRDLGDLSLLSQIKISGSFTKAASALGMTQSALSQRVKALEDRLGMKLLSRTTRSLSLTQAALEMVAVLAPAQEKLGEILAFSKTKNSLPSGKIRLTAPPDAANYFLFPFLKSFLPNYPEIQIEVLVDNAFHNLVKDGLDAGIRTAGLIEKDMISLKLSDRLAMFLVASPAYLKAHGVPKAPKDLMLHQCLNLLIGESGRIWLWPLENQATKEKLKFTPKGAFASTQPEMLLQASLDQMGIACLPSHSVLRSIESGKLVQVLKGWEPVLPGYALYYPGKRYKSAAFQALLEGLKAWRHLS
ncbi:LysR family transcriptional regulator [Acetobacteraceae bacterium]|nr:LysR family transcriptional regulator [Acetobacteraceae bacterium]